MPRVARIVVPHSPHHVTQRGNNKQDVFFVDDDRRMYLRILEQQTRLHGVGVLGFCLMTNHVHLVLVPARNDSLAKAVGRTHWLYTQYINRAHGRSGHLWQNRFHSNAMDDEACVLVMRYVDCNPTRSRMLRSAMKYHWSSASAHCDGKDPTGMLDLSRWKKLLADMNWQRELSREMSKNELSQIRRSTHTGRPLASDRFIAKLERALGKRLRALPPGRPRGTKKTYAKRKRANKK